jgi:hypothetical protein
MIVKKVGPVSLGKILGIIYAFFGFIIGLFFSFFMLMGTIFGSIIEDSPEPLVGLIFGFGSVVAFPVFYGLMGFLGGIITAGLYNVTSRWVGGIEIELEEKPAA